MKSLESSEKEHIKLNNDKDYYGSRLRKKLPQKFFNSKGYQSLGVGILMLVCSGLIWSLYYDSNNNRYYSQELNSGVLAFFGGASLYVAYQSITEGLKKINKMD